MALHPDFPRSPYEILPPDKRWFPAAEELRDTAYEKLLPPLVAKVREEIREWRDAGYTGASDTSRALLKWWFETDHLIEQGDGTQSQFRYYFAQREAVETVDHFRVAINALTIHDSGASRIEGHIRLRDTRPFRTEPRGFLQAKRSVFNRIVGEAGADRLELSFAAFLDSAPDVQAFGKNYMAVGFRLDYVRADGDLSTYTPDFIVRTIDGLVWIVDIKGREELDIPQKMARLKLWCFDATEAAKEQDGTRYGFVYVDQEGFEKHPPKTFAGLASAFREYQG